MKFIHRNITTRIKDACSDSPVILLHGARQTGKSTLVKPILKHDHPAEYITFDNPAYLSAASEDPDGFLDSFEGNVVLDEIQKVPGIFRAIKYSIDKNRQPGKYILTGSANILLLPKLSESLAGRMEILNLLPFSQSEITNFESNFVDEVFEDNPNFQVGDEPYETLLERILIGGYPEAVSRKNPVRIDVWFESYVQTILQRDIKDLFQINGLFRLPNLLKLLAGRNGGLVNFAEVSRSTGIAQTTLKRYVDLLRTSFLICLLPSFSRSFSKRIIKTPKVFLNDTGLLAHLLGVNIDRLHSDSILSGNFLENFVILELMKQSTWCKNRLNFSYYRTASGQEVDLIIERSDGMLTAVEIKSAKTPKAEMFKWLREFARETGKKFRRGIVIYAGKEIIPFGKNLTAVPVTALWGGKSAAC